MKKEEKKKQIKKLRVEDLVADPFKTMIRRSLRNDGYFIRPVKDTSPKRPTQVDIAWQ